MNNKVAKLAAKARLKAKQDEIIKLRSFDSSYFRCKSHFEDDDTQKCFSRFISILFQHGNPKDCLMKADNPATSDNSFIPSLDFTGVRTRAKFVGQCLKQDKITFPHKKIVNIYIVFEINLWPFRHDGDFTLGNTLFGVVKLTKTLTKINTKYGIGYSEYGIGFDKKKKGTQLILQSITKSFVLSFHYNGANSYIFINGFEFHKFKSKYSEIKAAALSLRNVSNFFLVDNVKETGLHVYVYDFSVDYDATAADDILDIHEYLMKKTVYE